MTDKNEKLFNAIGKLKDSYIEEAYCEPEKQPRSRRSVKRLVMVAVAAALFVTSAIAVVANSDAILSAIFERRQNLIDNKIGHIDESVTEGNITLTMDSVTVQTTSHDDTINDTIIFGTYTVSFHNENGAFDGGLKYGSYKMQCVLDDSVNGSIDAVPEIDEEGRKWYTLHGDKPEQCEAFYPALSKINFGLDEPSDTITLQSTLVYGKYGANRIIFYDLTSADGSVSYADELCVEFTVTKEIAKPLQQLQSYNPDISFEIENSMFNVNCINLSANLLTVDFTNPAGDSVNIGGVDCCAINYFTRLANSKEFFEKTNICFERELEARKRFESEYEEKEAIEKFFDWRSNDEELRKLRIEASEATKPTEDEKILNECYEVVVEVKPECGAEVTLMETYCRGWLLPASPDTVTVEFKAEFSSPIYVDDIVRVYARKIGDPTKQITIWVPAEDKGLAELTK